MFVMTLGSLTVFGQFSNKSQYQVAMVAGEIAGKAGSALSSSGSSSTPTDTSNTGNQSNSPYSGAGTSSSTPNPTPPSGTANGNPVTTPTGGNTGPAVPSNTAPTTVANNPVIDRTGQSNSQNTDNTDNQSTDNTTDTTDSTIPTGQTDLGAGTTVETEPPPLCTKKGTSNEATPTPAEDNGDTKKEEDKGFWGSLWSEVKDGLVAGYEFVKGFWEGMKKQVADLGDLLAHPIDTAKGLIELGKQFVKDPEGTAKMIADSLGDEFNTLVECGAFDKGRVIGENVSPAFMVKLASKMANFGDLAKALKATKKDFGCASFAAGTPIWTPDGKVNIDSLTKGNTVLSRARLSYQDKPQTIEKTFGRTAPSYYQLTTEFGTINVTEEHPIWKQSRGWTEVQYLKVDDIVASADGDVLVLDNKKVDKPIEVYNFSVENTPSYFAGVGKLWVHNAKCDLSIGIVKTRVHFEERYGKSFSSKKETEAGWRVYQQSSQSNKELVIGRLVDTESGAQIGMTRLNDPGWTPNVNDAWVQGGIDAKKKYYLGSNPNDSNLYNPPGSDYPTTVFHREIEQLKKAGYTQVGNYMVPPA